MRITVSLQRDAWVRGSYMQVFNDLHCSNRCRFISITWSVATASLHWILYNVYIKILKPVFHFDVMYRSISFCVEVISSTLVLRKQRNSGNWLIIKSGFVPIIVLMPPSGMSISQNDRTICWSHFCFYMFEMTPFIVMIRIVLRLY
jgi:hypothetical protein